jgi:hypothetical protein
VGRGLAIVLAALALAPVAHAGGPGLLVGATEDIVKQSDPVKAKAEVDLARRAGLSAIRISQYWAPGETAPSDGDLVLDGNAASAADADGIRVFVSILSYGSRTTPLSDQDQADFAAFAASLARSLPTVHDFIVGNEPNLNRYWMPQFGPSGQDVAAPAYVQLLAQTYDALKGVSPDIRVWGGAVSPRGGDRPNTGRDTHSPTVFIRDMGAAYRASGRTTPIMDGFAFHPYEDTSSAPPESTHPTTTSISLADYGKLVALLDAAFGPDLPIVYDEFGVETTIPPSKASLYTGNEPSTTKPVDEATQADYYRRAIQIAYCQPNVVGIFLFHTIDEQALLSWQSGLYYLDETPKLSRNVVAAAAASARRGVLAPCSWLRIRVKAQVDAAGRLTCDVDCTYVARLQRVPLLSTTLVVRGKAVGGVPTRLRFGRVARARYRISVVATAPVNPGPATVTRSPAFLLTR